MIRMRNSAPPLRAVFAGLILFALCLLLTGCGDSPEPGGRTTPENRAGPRIVSLSPALSRMLVDLDLQDHVVGRSNYSTSLDPDIPIIGNLTDLDFEFLVRVRPTHIFVQPPSTGVSDDLRRLADGHGWRIFARRIDDVDDSRAVLRDIPDAFDEVSERWREDLRQRAAALERRIGDMLENPPADAWRGRTLITAGGDPPLAYGTGTYLHELLTSRGGTNVVDAEGWVQLTLEDVVRLDPDGIIIVRQGEAGVEVDPEEAAPRLAALDVQAVRAGRVGVLSHPEALLPSTSILALGRLLDAILTSWSGGEL